MSCLHDHVQNGHKGRGAGCRAFSQKRAVTDLCKHSPHVQVKQTMARIKQVLTERALAEPNERVRKLAMDKINAN
jgi:hypothetical protein